jgi:hypothetical protein
VLASLSSDALRGGFTVRWVRWPNPTDDAVNYAAILPASGDPCDTPTAVIGLRRDQSATAGVVEGLRMRYESDGTAYETVLSLP